jgi:DNA-binding CsgD family transcriptional regulator
MARGSAARAGSSMLAGRRAARDRAVAEQVRHYQPVVLDRLAALAAQALGVERSAILARADARSDALTVAAVSGGDPDLVGRRFSIDAGLAERVLSFGRPMAIHGRGGLGEVLRRAAPPGARAAAAAPIHFAGGPAGLLSVWKTMPGEPFGEPELALLAEFAELCGLALGHHERRGGLAATAEIQVRALETALGLWDGYTAEHSEAVVRLAVRVGQRLRMSALDLFELRLAARLHDVGKIRVPGEILRKPAALSAKERQVIELHPAWGAQLVGQIAGLQAVAAIVRFHHERPDGAGYPSGLRGERIPLAARVVATCDAYRAMTEHRPYRPARPSERALAELQSAAGQQFDARVVDALEREVVVRPLTPSARHSQSDRRPPAAAHRRRSTGARSLSRRELQVLTLLARGASGPEAAAALGLSPETVRTHVKNATKKLDAHTRTHAVALAIASGQISPQAEPPAPRAAARSAGGRGLLR